MKDVLIYLGLGIGGTMIFFGNPLGYIGLIPALIQTIKDAKTI